MNTKRRASCVTTTLIGSLSALVSMVAVSTAAFADEPPKHEIYFKAPPTYAGSGCQKGTAHPSLSPDKKAFNVVFDNYVAEINPGQLFQRKFCNLEVPVHVPQGWTFAVTSVTYRGALQLDWGTSARENSVYYFKGWPGSAQASSTWHGVIDDMGLPVPYEFTDYLPMETWVWKRCGIDTPLEIKTDYTVRNNKYKTGHAYASADTIDGQVSTIYHLSWKKCHK